MPDMKGLTLIHENSNVHFKYYKERNKLWQPDNNRKGYSHGQQDTQTCVTVRVRAVLDYHSVYNSSEIKLKVTYVTLVL